MAHNTLWDEPRGLVDPANERDACGVGFIGELNKVPTRSCVVNALEMLLRMTHRGACGCEVNSGVSPCCSVGSGDSRYFRISRGDFFQKVMWLLTSIGVFR
jgi:glutamate synthase (NADPH/NADH)